jgi:phosphoglycolate phosphatase-like HAD superfamily hydrolase
MLYTGGGGGMKYSAIFFDFDGTIVASNGIKNAAFVELYSRYSEEVARKVAREEIAHGGISRFEKIKTYHKNFLGIDLTEEEIKKIAAEFGNMITERVINAPYIAGSLDTIKAEFEKGTKLFIITGTPTPDMQQICKARNIEKYFTDILGSPVQKSVWVRTLLDKYAFLSTRCLFIGDAIEDYNAAHENGIHFLGIVANDTQSPFPKDITIKSEVVL